MPTKRERQARLELLGWDAHDKENHSVGIEVSRHDNDLDTRSATASVRKQDALVRSSPDHRLVGYARQAETIGAADAAALIELSQALSSEIDLEKLAEAFMRIVIEQSQSHRALLILRTDDGFRVAAEATVDACGITVQARDTELSVAILPLSIARHVIEAKELVVIHDTDRVHDFYTDKYFHDRHCRSLLCFPILRHAELVGVLYIENELSPQVFDESKVHWISILTDQAGISIENARLYAALRLENAERKQTEVKLRRSEALLAEGQRISKTGAWMWNLDSGEMLWSQQVYEIWGIDTTDRNPEFEELLTRVVPDDRAALRDGAARALLKDNIYSIEFSIIHANGDIRRLQLMIRPWTDPDERPRYYIGTTADVTESRAAEDALRRSEMYLSEAQRLSNIGSIGWKIGTRILICSAQAYRILDVVRSDPVDLDYILQCVHPDDIERVRRALAETENSSANLEIEFRLRTAVGAIKHLRMVARRIVSAAKDIEYVGALADMTEVHNAQSALLRAQAELTHVARISTLGELTATIAHDLKQPLTAILANGEAGIRWLDRPAPSVDDARASLRCIVESAGRANQVIDRLRALARKERSNRSTIDMKQTVEEVILLVRQEIERNGIRLRILAEENLPGVSADKIQIQQVLMNLIINAMHAVSQSKSDIKSIEILTNVVTDKYVRVSVIDSGTGISYDIVDRLFSPFFTTKSDGMGLGLSICRSIIDEHRGLIHAVNNEQQGATFYFELPYVAAM